MARFVRRFERHSDNGTVTSSNQAFRTREDAAKDAKFSKYTLNGGAKNVRTYVDTYPDGPWMDLPPARLHTEEIE